MPVRIQQESHFPLPWVRLRLLTDRPAAALLADLSAAVLNDNTFFPLRPIKAQRRLLGDVNGSSFSFARLKWFSFEVNPRCVGRVFVENGMTVLEAEIRAWSLLISPALFAVFVGLVLHRAGALTFVPFAMILTLTAYLVAAFWVGVERLKSILRELAGRTDQDPAT